MYIRAQDYSDTVVDNLNRHNTKQRMIGQIYMPPGMAT